MVLGYNSGLRSISPPGASVITMSEDSGTWKATGPVCLHFRTSRAYYIYDTPTNEILQLPEELWLATQTPSFWLDPLPETPQEHRGAIIDALSAGHFSKRRPVGLALPVRDTGLRQALDQGVHQVVLEVTTACNLRCSYCTYSGHYPTQRQHGVENMPLSTARSAVDFLAAHGACAKHAFIGFYGGEPTLRMETIEEVVRYSASVSPRPVQFNLTTNGYSIPDEALRFLVDNNFSLLVSLDGPRDTHDRFRRTPAGKGTWSMVLETLHRLRAISDPFFRSRLQLSVVIGPPHDLAPLRRFFDTEPLLAEVNLRVTSVARETPTFFHSAAASLANEVPVSPDGRWEALKKAFLDSLVEGTPKASKFSAALFEGEFLRLHKRQLHRGYGHNLPLNGMCIPGSRRVFVTTEGKLQVCEKVSSDLTIGDLERGFDVPRIASLLATYAEESRQRCLSCFANRLCSACFAQCFSDVGFQANCKRHSCESIREDLARTLIDYCTVLEANPGAFDYMASITVS